MSNQEQIAEKLKKEVRSLLIASKTGLTPQQLEKDYLEVVGNRLPLRTLGFRSTMEMVLDMPDVVRVCPSGDGNVILEGIPDEATKRIASLVARQQSSRSRYSHHKSRIVFHNPHSKLPRRNRTTPILPAVVKSELRDLLTFSPVLVSKFDQAFRQRFGRDFQYTHHGFYSMFEVLQAASDIVTVQQTRAGSLMVLKNSPMERVMPGNLTKTYQPWKASMSMSRPQKQPSVQHLPIECGMTPFLQGPTTPPGTQKGLVNPNLQGKTFPGTQNGLMTPYLQRQVSPSGTQKRLGTPSIREQTSTLETQKPACPLYVHGKTLSPGTQKSEVTPHVHVHTYPPGTQNSLSPISQQEKTLHPVTQKELVAPCLQEHVTTVTQRGLLTTYMQGHTSPIEAKEQGLAPYMQGQTLPPGIQKQLTPYLQGMTSPLNIQKQELAPCMQAQVSPVDTQRAQLTLLQQEKASHTVTQKQEANSDVQEQTSPQNQHMETTCLPRHTSSPRTPKHEVTSYLQGHNSPAGIYKPEQSSNLHGQTLLEANKDSTHNPPAAGTAEYFVWRLQQIEEEMRICLAKKGPGGTIDAELKEKIRFVAAQHDDGLLVYRLPTEFKDIFEEEIPLKELGFVNLLELVVSLSDILHLECKDGDQKMRIFDAKKWRKNCDLKLAANGVQNYDLQLKEMTHAILLSSWDSPLENKDPEPKNLGIITRDSQLWKLKEPLLITGTETAEVPPDAVHNQDLQRLPPLQMGTLLGVFVETVISPSQFYVRFYSKDTSEMMQDMMIEMRRCYSSDNVSERYLIPPGWICPGLVCCVRIQNDVWWYRVIVHNILNEQEVDVFYPDFGNLATVRKSWLRLLKSCYLKLPAQAVPSSLAWIKPVETYWTATAIKRFQNLCDLRPLVSVIHEYMDDVLYLFLCDTTADEDLYLHNVLREEGHGLVLRESLPSKGFRELNPAALYLKPVLKGCTDNALVTKRSPTPQELHCLNSCPVEHPQGAHLHDGQLAKYPQGSHPHDLSLHQGCSAAKDAQCSYGQDDSPAKHPQVSYGQEESPANHSQASYGRDDSPAMHAQGSHHQDDFPSKCPQGSPNQDGSPAKHIQVSHIQDDVPAKQPQELNFRTASATKHPHGSPSQYSSPDENVHGSDHQYGSPAKHPQSSNNQYGRPIEQNIRSLDSTGKMDHVQDKENSYLELPYLEPLPAGIDVWDENWPRTTDCKVFDSDSILPSDTGKPEHLPDTDDVKEQQGSRGDPHKTLPAETLQITDTWDKQLPRSHNVGNGRIRDLASQALSEEFRSSEKLDFFGETSAPLSKSLEEFYISLIKSKQSSEPTSREPSPPPVAFEQPQTAKTTGIEAKSEMVAPTRKAPPSCQAVTLYSGHWNSTFYQPADDKQISPMLAASAPVSRQIHIPRIPTTAALGASARMATSGGLLHWIPYVKKLEV